MITREFINRVISMNKKMSENSQTSYDRKFNLLREEAYKSLSYLEPYSNKRVKTGIIFDGDEIVLWETLKFVPQHARKSRELNMRQWFKGILDPHEYSQEKIDRIALFIKDEDKSEIFKKLNEVMSKHTIPFSSNFIDVKREIKPISLYSFTHNYGNPQHYENIVKAISYNGYRFSLILHDNNNEYDGSIELDFDLSRAQNLAILANIFDQIEPTLNELMEEWKAKIDKVYNDNNELVFKTRQLTARYEVIARL